MSTSALPPVYSPEDPGMAYQNQPADRAYPPPTESAKPTTFNQPQPQYGQPQQQGYWQQQQQGYGQPQPMQGYNKPMQGYGQPQAVVTGQPAPATIIVTQRAERPPTYLVLAIVVTLFCNFVCGIIAIIFSVLSDSAYDDGDVESARTRGKISMGLSIAGILSSVIGVVIVIVYFFAIVTRVSHFG